MLPENKVNKDNIQIFLCVCCPTSPGHVIWSDLYRYKQDGVSALRGNGHGVPPLTKKLFALDSCQQRKNQFSPTNNQLLVYQPHSRSDPMLRLLIFQKSVMYSQPLRSYLYLHYIIYLDSPMQMKYAKNEIHCNN